MNLLNKRLVTSFIDRWRHMMKYVTDNLNNYRTVFNIRAGSLGLRNRTGRTVQDKTCQKCTEGEVENEQHVVLKCQAYRVERNRMLGKVRRIWGEERWEVWGGGGKEEGEQLKEIVGLVGEPSEVLARTVGDGVRKMMKKREEEKR